LKPSMMVSDRRRITQSPLSPVQSPILVSKITIVDCCWHGQWCGAYMDDVVAPTWMTTWHLRGWRRGTYVDDDITIVLAYQMYTARKKAGPQFFQPISKLQFKNMKPKFQNSNSIHLRNFVHTTEVNIKASHQIH
jgi:hypothetical protein